MDTSTLFLLGQQGGATARRTGASPEPWHCYLPATYVQSSIEVGKLARRKARGAAVTKVRDGRRWDLAAIPHALIRPTPQTEQVASTTPTFYGAGWTTTLLCSNALSNSRAQAIARLSRT